MHEYLVRLEGLVESVYNSNLSEEDKKALFLLIGKEVRDVKHDLAELVADSGLPH